MAKSQVYGGLIKALLAANLVSVGFFLMRVAVTGNLRYWFLFWNLFLAWVPVALVWWLSSVLKVQRWHRPLPIILSILFILFLPNSFYVISDFIHLHNSGEVGILFDVLLFMSISTNALVAGMISLYFLHTLLLQRFTVRLSHSVITVLLLAVSFAIYLGRSLRWNSWDVFFRPFGFLYDVSERVINPLDHPEVIGTTVTFFLFLGSLYMVVYQTVAAIRHSRR